jgi:polysaccharide export outer membrane protein
LRFVVVRKNGVQAAESIVLVLRCPADVAWNLIFNTYLVYLGLLLVVDAGVACRTCDGKLGVAPLISSCASVNLLPRSLREGHTVGSVRLSWLVALFALMAFAIAGCAPRATPDLQSGQLAVPDATTLRAAGELRVAPLDVLEVRVFGVPDLDGSYQVDPQGNLRMPLIGVVQVNGFTTFELAAELERLFGERYIQDPQVIVQLTTETRLQITVEGAVDNPGIYPISGALTLLQAVALSGGTAEDADLGSIIIFRTIEGERRAARFDLRDIRVGAAEDPHVFGNDVIVVVQSETRRRYTELLRALPVVGVFLRPW